MKDKIMRFLSLLGEIIINKLTEAVGRWRQFKYQRQLIWLNNCIADMIPLMQQDLFEVFSEQVYKLLQMPNTASAIRFVDWDYKNDTFHYYFAIDRQGMERISNFLLNDLMGKISYDIAMKQRELIGYFGIEAVQLMRPFLYHGIYPVAIQNRSADVMITFVTHLSPRQFNDRYRQFRSQIMGY